MRAENEKVNISALVTSFRRSVGRLWWLLPILAALGAGLMFLNARNSYRPQYKSEALFSVSSGYESSMDIMSYNYYYDNSAAQMLADTFPFVLQTDVMREMLKNELGMSTINGSINVSSVAGTNLFTLSVTSPDPQDAYDIVNAVMTVYPQAGRLVIGDIRLSVSRAPELPTESYNTFDWKTGVVRGAAIGLLIWLIIAAIGALRARTVMSASELASVVNLNCLGVVPAVRRRKRSGDRGLIYTDEKSDSAFAESVRTIRVRLARELKKADAHVVAVTSTLASEGKTTIAVNTAIALAKDGCRVLLVDADLRNHSIKEALGITTESKGLGELLEGSAGNRLSLLVGPYGLRILAGDKTFDSPLELIREEEFGNVMKLIGAKFDYVIMDTPPAGMMSDAMRIGQFADAMLYVVRADCAPRAQIAVSVQALYDSGIKLIGCVFNGAEHGEHSSGYGYKNYGYGYGYKSYGYGYGYGYGKSKNYGDTEK